MHTFEHTQELAAKLSRSFDMKADIGGGIGGGHRMYADKAVRRHQVKSGRATGNHIQTTYIYVLYAECVDR